MKQLLLTLFTTLFLTGCATTDQAIYDSTPRTATTSCDVYKDGRMPERKCKQIAELSYLGPREEELKAQRNLVARAQKLGGNAIVFTVVPAGQRGGGIAGPNGGGFGISTAWVFKAMVLVYE